MSEERLSKILSLLFHPLLMPTYGLIVYFQLQSYMGMELIPKVKWMLVLFIFSMTFFISLSLTMTMKKLGLVSSLQMPVARERIIPLFVTAIIFIITFYSMRPTGLLPDFQLFILGTALLTLIALLISIFTKISIHMIGIGGVTGALIAIGLTSNVPVTRFIYLSILISGLLGFARLRLGAHKEFQIYLGYLLGLFVMGSIFLLV